MAEVKDIDRGLKALLKRLGPQASMRVGIFGDNAAQRATDGHGASVGDIASAHEFGVTEPPRAWLRGTLEKEADTITAGIRKAAAGVIKRTMPAEQALNLLGQGIVGKIKSRIAGGISPALSENYLPRKLAKYPGATTPLIASGQMRGAITSEVLPAGAPSGSGSGDGRARDSRGRFI